MPSGGKRPGAGRPKGSGLATKSSAIAKSEVESGRVTPLEVMLKAMRKHYEAEAWDKAAAIAERAAPYVHPRLQSVAHTGKGGGPISFVDLKALSDDQLAALEPVLEQLAASTSNGHDEDV